MWPPGQSRGPRPAEPPAHGSATTALNQNPHGADIEPVRGPTEPTGAAKRFRVVVVLGSAALCVSIFLPWCSISGFTYSFLDVDSWRALPIAEVVVAAGAAIAAVTCLSKIKRIGLLLGGSALVLNLAGAFVAAHLANVHNNDPYYRIWAVLSVRPAWGGGIAILASVILLVGALSGWTVQITHRQSPAVTGTMAHSESAPVDALHGIPRQFRVNDDFG